MHPEGKRATPPTRRVGWPPHPALSRFQSNNPKAVQIQGEALVSQGEGDANVMLEAVTLS
jgi:hypothetical protein